MPATQVPGDPDSQTWEVERETELRVACPGSVQVTLLEGVAEVFGIEMKLLMPYTFFHTSFAIFSWYGAKIKVTDLKGGASSSSSSGGSSGSSSNSSSSSTSASGGGAPSRKVGAPSRKVYVYESKDSHMMSDYVQLHGKVEEARVAALTADIAGPRVIVVGPPNSGKSSLVRLLCSYAVRMSRVPLYVDLDVGANDASMPGSIVASPVDMRSVSVEHGVRAKYPLAFYFGHSEPAANADLFKRQVDALASVVDRCLEKNVVMQNSGIIVNACGWDSAGGGVGRDVLTHAVRALKCDVVVVVKNDRMFLEMQSEFDPELTVLKVPQSGGVEELGDLARRRQARQQAHIRRYFYGHPYQKKSQLAPALRTISFDDVTIVRIGDDRDDTASHAMTPLGQEHLMKVDPFRVRTVDPSDRSSGILHAVLGVSHAEDEGSIVKENVAGYVWVKAVDMEKRTLDVLQPNHIDFLQKKTLILGSFTFIDRDN